MTSKIEWTNETWNPVTGCSKVSEGCKHCYAEREWGRLSANPKTVYHGRKFTDVMVHPERLDQPLRWKRPRMIFVNSMSDLFHESAEPLEIAKILAVAILCPHHTFQILTKRATRLVSLVTMVEEAYEIAFTNALRGVGHIDPETIRQDRPKVIGNVWLGVSVEDQKTADERIPLLLATPAAVRFISYEPALGPIDLDDIEALIDKFRFKYTLGRYLDWVIAGGESGPNARPSHPDWFRKVRDQCQAAGVPFFFKQWGEWAELDPKDAPTDPNEIGSRAGCEYYTSDGNWDSCAWDPSSICMKRYGKKRAGRKLDGREWNEYPGGGV